MEQAYTDISIAKMSSVNNIIFSYKPKQTHWKVWQTTILYDELFKLFMSDEEKLIYLISIKKVFEPSFVHLYFDEVSEL